MEFLTQPWPWYVAGPLLAVVPIILLFFGKSFGVSATMRTTCAAFGFGKVLDFFKYNWKNDYWNLVFVLGAVIGGYIANEFMTPENYQVAISEKTVRDLKEIGVETFDGLAPDQFFALDAITNLSSLLILIIGGLFIGFGARYAGGCTSGHAISGISNLQLPSLIAVIGFFIGGVIMTFFILPYILNL